MNTDRRLQIALEKSRRNSDLSANGVQGNRFSSVLPQVYAGHPLRIERYSQYDQMDMDSEINAALDTIADFCTQKDQTTASIFELVYDGTQSDTEIEILKTCLHQWIKINEFGKRFWRTVRSTLKYGDQFFIRDPETLKWFWVEQTNVEKILVNEANGKEPEAYLIRNLNLNATNLTATQSQTYGNNIQGAGTNTLNQTGGSFGASTGRTGPATNAGRYSSDSNQSLTAVDATHMIHLSLSEGLDANWPFGISILESVFKVFRQKELLEDAVIIYRIIRAPERRIFYIDTGQMPPHKAGAYIEKVKNEIYQKRIPSRSGGSCLDLNTMVPLLDGRTLSISELAKEFEQGKVNWAYSCDPETGKYVPGMITWAGVTRHNTQVMKLTLDNGEVITCTPDHKFPLRGKGKTEAKDIKLNDSLISFNERIEPISKNESTYHQTFDHSINEWRFTHRLTGSFFKFQGLHNELIFDPAQPERRKAVIHHVDYNRYNNNPDNLVYMNGYDHFKLHGANHTPINQTLCFSELMFTIVKDYAKKVGVLKKKLAVILSNDVTFMNEYKQLNAPITKPNKLKYDRFTVTALEKLIKEFNFKTWKEFILSLGRRQSQPVRRLNWDISLLVMLVNTAKKTPGLYIKEAVVLLNKNAEFMSRFVELNGNVKRHATAQSFTENTIRVMLEHFNYKHWGDFTSKINSFNHQVTNIEYCDDLMDVGTLTIDGNEKYHGHHTFALKQGVYTFNSALGLDAAYSPMCLDMSTRIPLIDGRTLTISELAGEYEAGKKNWAYSCNPSTGDIVPGVISWAGETRKNAEIIKLYFSNGSNLICTPDHKIPTVDRGFVEARNLSTNDKLRSFLSDVAPKYTNRIISIEVLDYKMDVGTLTIDKEEEFNDYHTFAIEQGIFVKNSMVDDFFFSQCIALDTLIPLQDNRILSLQSIIDECQAGKANYVYSQNQKTFHSETGKVVWAGKTRSNAQVVEITLSNKKSIVTTPDHRFVLSNHEFVEAQDLKIDMVLESFTENNLLYIKSINWLNQKIDTGDITIQTKTESHVFAVDAGVYIHNSGDGRGSKVETLPGGASLGEIADLKWFQNKLIRGLRVPSSYLPVGVDDGQQAYQDGRTGTAYIQEFRFATYCERLQSLLSPVFDSEFKLFVKQRGFNIESNIFELQFTTPQHFSDYARAEKDSAMINVFTPLAEMKYFSKRFLMKRYLGMTEEEITDNETKWQQENPDVVEATGGGDAAGAASSMASDAAPGIDSMGMDSGEEGGDDLDAGMGDDAMAGGDATAEPAATGTDDQAGAPP